MKLKINNNALQTLIKSKLASGFGGVCCGGEGRGGGMKTVNAIIKVG